MGPAVSELLYLSDSYVTEFDARVTHLAPDGVYLDRTAFYPAGGGQPADRGELRSADGARWPVVGAEKTSQGVLHRLADRTPPEVGRELHGTIDWGVRYAHMRYHTALHLLSGVVYHRWGSGITGGQIYGDRARMDFSMPEFSRALAEELLLELNRRSAEGLPVSIRNVPRATLLADPSLVRVARELLPEVDPVRLIEIGDFDIQADGGTHVRSTREVGLARLDRIENKGARNKRLYLTLEPPPGGPP